MEETNGANGREGEEVNRGERQPDEKRRRSENKAGNEYGGGGDCDRQPVGSSNTSRKQRAGGTYKRNDKRLRIVIRGLQAEKGKEKVAVKTLLRDELELGGGVKMARTEGPQGRGRDKTGPARKERGGEAEAAEDAEGARGQCRAGNKRDREETGSEKGTTGEEERRERRAVFWNSAGIRNKTAEFWEYLRGFEVVGLGETWVEEKDWEKVRESLPDEYEWRHIPATRNKKKERAGGGILMGIRNGDEGRTAVRWETDDKSYIWAKEDQGRDTWNIAIIYANEEKEKTRESLTEKLEESKGEFILLGGTGTQGRQKLEGGKRGKRREESPWTKLATRKGRS